ncbi:septum site-determining protein MinC [Nodularia harveyana UHCC-0300]|uniref:Probable septum site-determining protein MinC n=1 Tax=Nodularia harveyana UHCC-0300 TaxID=2974287 RepID=A0ABU5UE44_9CYAN|nr:septum site-determining protein MinC [Nodularia harveyana]MEA5581801.1 septum site-determining protein MinC [Nodularia harveyana UHCC-0300]
MTSDSHIPNLESNSDISDLPVNPSSADDKSTNVGISQANSDNVIPDAEVDSVINYLQSNSDPDIGLKSTPNDPESVDVLENLDLDIDSPESLITKNRLKNHIQVQFKSEGEKLLVILPTESQIPASEVAGTAIWEQLKLRLNASDRLRSSRRPVHLVAQDRLLDGRQLQEFAEAFSEAQLELRCVATSRRQTAIAAVTSGYSVEQLQPETSLKSELKTPNTTSTDALYLEMTVRSGTEIRHPGTVIILGDINPGGIVVAEGDIVIWGRLRGIAHAGAGGNRECLIMSLQMEPTQLRIADAVARAPKKTLTQVFPEVAHITPDGIRIAKANDFSRTQLNRLNQIP